MAKKRKSENDLEDPTSLMFASAESGNTKKLKKALDSGAKLETLDDAEFTALSVAAKHGKLEAIKMLLKYGAIVTNDTITCASKSVYSSEFILEHLQLAQIVQARPKVDNKYTSALDKLLIKASYSGNLKQIEKAIKGGAVVDTFDATDASPLRWAIRGAQIEAVKLLLDLGASINQQSSNGWTALMEAVVGVNLPIVKLLLKFSPNVDLEIFNGNDAETFARMMMIHTSKIKTAEKIYSLLIGEKEVARNKRRNSPKYVNFKCDTCWEIGNREYCYWIDQNSRNDYLPECIKKLKILKGNPSPGDRSAAVYQCPDCKDKFDYDSTYEYMAPYYEYEESIERKIRKKAKKK